MFCLKRDILKERIMILADCLSFVGKISFKYFAGNKKTKHLFPSIMLLVCELCEYFEISGVGYTQKSKTDT